MTRKLELALNITTAASIAAYGALYVGRMGQLLLSDGSRSVQLVEAGSTLFSVAMGSFGVAALIKLGRGETYCCSDKQSRSRCHLLEVSCAWGLLLGTSLLLPSKIGNWLEQATHLMPLIALGDLLRTGTHSSTLEDPRRHLLAISQLASLKCLSQYPLARWTSVIADTINIATVYSWVSGKDDAIREQLMQKS